MDQFLKETETILRGITDVGSVFSIWEAIFAIVLTFLMTMIIGKIYQKTHQGVSYSVSFVHTLIITGVVVSAIMLIIGSNIARAFALVGALSIIRFRSAIKDPRDVAFIFLSMAVGMAAGTKFYLLSVVLTVLLSLIIYTLHVTRFGEQRVEDYLFRVFTSGQRMEDLEEILKRHTEGQRWVHIDSQARGGTVVHTIGLNLKNQERVSKLVAELEEADFVERTEVIFGNEQIAL